MSHGKIRFQTSIDKLYFKLPNDIFHVGLSSSAVAVFAYLVSHRGTFHPGTRMIAKAVRLSRNTIKAAITQLERAQMVTVKRDRVRNEYVMHDHKEWIKIGAKGGTPFEQILAQREGHIQEEQEDYTKAHVTTNGDDAGSVEADDLKIEEVVAAAKAGVISVESPEQRAARLSQEHRAALANPLFLEAFGDPGLISLALENKIILKKEDAS